MNIKMENWKDYFWCSLTTNQQTHIYMYGNTKESGRVWLSASNILVTKGNLFGGSTNVHTKVCVYDFKGVCESYVFAFIPVNQVQIMCLHQISLVMNYDA